MLQEQQTEHNVYIAEHSYGDDNGPDLEVFEDALEVSCNMMHIVYFIP